MEDFDVLARIQELCDLRSWTYYRLAKEANIPYSTLSTMLRKTNAPTVHTLQKLCAGFGITLAQFFALDDETVAFSKDQCEFLTEWDKLDETSKQLALAYMQGLKYRQEHYKASGNN